MVFWRRHLVLDRRNICERWNHLGRFDSTAAGIDGLSNRDLTEQVTLQVLICPSDIIRRIIPVRRVMLSIQDTPTSGEHLTILPVDGESPYRTAPILRASIWMSARAWSHRQVAELPLQSHLNGLLTTIASDASRCLSSIPQGTAFIE